MRILTRYLLRAHVGPFIFALSILTGLLFVNTVARRFPSLAGKGLPTSVLLKVMALSLPHIIALTLPMAVLVAVLYAYSQMTADNEVTALKASGVNLLRMLVPLLVAAALLSGFMVWFNDRILPETNHSLAELMMDINSKSPTLQLKPQVVNYIPTADYSTRYYLRAGEIDFARNDLRDVVIYDVTEPLTSQTVYADSGHMAFNRDRTDLFLTLYNGRVDQVKSQSPKDIERVFFKQQMIQLKGINTQFERSKDSFRSDREMSLDTLAGRINTARTELAQVRAGVAAAQDRALTLGLPGAGLPVDSLTIAEREKSLQSQINSFSVEWHKKFAIPFACIIFVLIGAPIAVRFPRGGAGMVIAISLLVFGVYYMSLIGGESLGDKGVIPPFLGPWAPNFFFGAIGLLLVIRIGREMSTSRGGDWDDMRSTIIAFFTRPFRRSRT